jgi:hypothetical protein
MPTAGQIAKEWGVAKSYVQRCIKKGCPTDFEGARLWRTANTSKRATTSPKQIAKLLAEEKDSDAPEARKKRKAYFANKPAGYRLPSGDSLKNALSNAIEASEEAFRLLKEAMIEEKDQKISARLAVFNKSSENRFKAECSYREELERRRILIPLAEAMDMARRGYDVILQRLNTLPQNAAYQCNCADPSQAITALESECSAILRTAQEVYAAWSKVGPHSSTAPDAE